MSTRFSVERMEKKTGDTILFGIFILLLGLGISIMFSASFFYADYLFKDSAYFLKRQLAWMGLGLVSAFVMYHLPLDVIRKFSAVFFIFSFFMTLLTFVPGIGMEIMGAKRWIYVFGNTFQPSELVKLALVIYFSYLISNKEESDINDVPNSLLPLLIALVMIVLPVYLQNDFSTALFIISIAFLYLFLARVKLSYFVSVGIVAVPLIFLLLFTKEYRVRRLIAFLAPETDPAGAAYQVIASQSALARGGLWGVGLGSSTKKMGGLPEAHSDFIFAVLGEEAGLIGALFILGLFVLLAVRGFRIAEQAQTRFSHYLAVGLTLMIVLQAFLNIAVVCGLVPATGITLPFFSSGGSSLLVVMTMCGILLNISKNHQDKHEGEYV